mmetsp:Transcript_26042/g.26257  ORF Transcript_26042/g.26257 Transcript_26042/m.26257 type:complete len:106 (+) Transcript_26042:180-497(+)
MNSESSGRKILSQSRAKRTKALLVSGVPLVICILGGSYFLSNFLQTEFEMKDKKVNSVSTRKFNIEEEHARMMGKLNLDQEYSLSRIPRPDEDNNDYDNKLKIKK